MVLSTLTAFSDGSTRIYAAWLNAVDGILIGPVHLNARAPEYGAVGDGVTDDSAALNAFLVAIKSAASGSTPTGGVVGVIPPGIYKINSRVLLTLTSGNAVDQMVISAYGAVFLVNTTAEAGIEIVNSGSNSSLRNFIWQGGVFTKSTGSTETAGFKITNTGTSYTYRFQIRDVVVEDSNGHGIHIDDSAASAGTGTFEFQLVNCAVGGVPTNKYGIWLNGAGGTISSVEVISCNTRNGLNGLRVDNQSVNILGGTYLLAQNECIYAQIQGGLIAGAHVESGWQSAVSAGTGSGHIYIEGWCDVTGLVDYRAPTAKAKWAIDAYNYGGPLNISGRNATGASYPTIRLRAGEATGVANLIGIEPSEVDDTAAVAAGGRTINYIGVLGNESMRLSAGLGIGAARIYSGSGTPEGSVSAPVGSLYLRTNGGASTSVYVKESGSGNTGWVGK